MKNVFGIIFSNMHDHRIRELTRERCMGSVPVGGRYRLVDFVLSGFSNAGIINTAVITKSNYQSLLDHLGNGREWDLARKRGGLMILPPAALSDRGNIYRGRIDALHGIMGFIHDHAAEYIVMADCDAMANIDFEDFVKTHQRSGAEITVMYKKQDMEHQSAAELSAFTVDGQQRVTDMRINPEAHGEQNIWMNILIINKDVLEWAIRDCMSRNLESFERDVLQANLNRLNIHAYEFTGYTTRFHSLKAYYDANLELLDPKARAALFPKDRPIYTSVWDEAPVRYGLDAHVENTLLADGCIIEGEVENSLLFRGVHIGKGAKVKNCVLMQGTHVGAHATLDCVITDKRVMIKDNRILTGVSSYPTYIAKGSVV